MGECNSLFDFFCITAKNIRCFYTLMNEIKPLFTWIITLYTAWEKLTIFILKLGRNTVRITKCHKLEMETIVLPFGY